MRHIAHCFTAAILLCAASGVVPAQDFRFDSPSAFAEKFERVTAAPSVALIVTKTADTNDGVCGADCSLREAIATVNNTAAAADITFNIPAADPGCANKVCTITLTGGELLVRSLAPGAVTITRTGLNGITISGSNASRVFRNDFNSTLTLNGLTVSGGNAVTGAGLFNDGVLTVINSTISNNTASDFGGGVLSNGGGGVFNLINSTVSNNTAGSANNNGGGGGIDSSGTLNISNSTIAFNRSSAFFPLSNSGGIWSRGVMNLKSSIVANNTVFNAESAPDIYFAGGLMNSGGNNLIGNSVVTGKPISLNTTTGTRDLANQNPGLAPLGNYGGFTQTHAFALFDSPAIDNGNAAGLAVDQRGKPRPFNIPSKNNESDGADIGAYELQNPTAARVSLGGRVTSVRGGVAKAVVYLTDQTGRTRQTITNFSGSFDFTNVQAGETVVINVSHKRFTFQPQIVPVNDDITDLQFQADQ